ncbi:MAG TPA: hypothetical protein PKA98_00105 [Acidimicrobiales bacterium]|nr:hypothetical protein [Acidimicrobiales bacterium]
MPLQVEWKPSTRRRPGALAWAAVGFSVFAGFLVGPGVTGAETAIHPTATIVVMGGFLTIASLAVTAQANGRRGWAGFLAATVWLTGWVGGLLIGVGGRAGEDLRGAAQLRAWFGTREARVGATLLGLCLALATLWWSRSRPPHEHQGGGQP